MTSGSLDAEALRELAPDGAIRVAVNLANAATVTVTDGRLMGPAPQVVEALHDWTGLPVDIIRFASAKEIVAAGEKGGQWDIAFLAVDPSRADLFHFTAPYKVIEATAVVPMSSAIASAEELDAPGVRIATAKGAAYDAVLSRILRHAERVIFPSPSDSMAGFEAEGLDAVAGIRESLERAFGARADIRILPGCIAAISHAIAVPIQRRRAAALLDSFAGQHFGG